MFKKLFAYFKKEKELMDRTEELHAETERILAKEEDRKNNPVFQPVSPVMFKFADADGNVYEVPMLSDECAELLGRKDVHLIFD